MKDEPDPDQLASDNQDDLVVHIAARSLLRALFRHVDGACTYFCRWCFDILITASANDPVRLVALKLLGVIRESLVDRPEFVRQLVAYYQLRNFGRPTHIVQSTQRLTKKLRSACISWSCPNTFGSSKICLLRLRLLRLNSYRESSQINSGLVPTTHQRR